jgi:hypothetical protein
MYNQDEKRPENESKSTLVEFNSTQDSLQALLHTLIFRAIMQDEKLAEGEKEALAEKLSVVIHPDSNKGQIFLDIAGSKKRKDVKRILGHAFNNSEVFDGVLPYTVAPPRNKSIQFTEDAAPPKNWQEGFALLLRHVSQPHLNELSNFSSLLEEGEDDPNRHIVTTRIWNNINNDLTKNINFIRAQLKEQYSLSENYLNRIIQKTDNNKIRFDYGLLYALVSSVQIRSEGSKCFAFNLQHLSLRARQLSERPLKENSALPQNWENAVYLLLRHVSQRHLDELSNFLSLGEDDPNRHIITTRAWDNEQSLDESIHFIRTQLAEQYLFNEAYLNRIIQKTDNNKIRFDYGLLHAVTGSMQIRRQNSNPVFNLQYLSSRARELSERPLEDVAVLPSFNGTPIFTEEYSAPFKKRKQAKQVELVLDISSSMEFVPNEVREPTSGEQSRLDILKAAVIELAQQTLFPLGFDIKITTFASERTSVGTFSAGNKEEEQKFTNAVNGLNTDGYTILNLAAAQAYMDNLNASGETEKIVALFSDGENYSHSDAEKRNKHIEAYNNQNNQAPPIPKLKLKLFFDTFDEALAHVAGKEKKKIGDIQPDQKPYFLTYYIGNSNDESTALAAIQQQCGCPGSKHTQIGGGQFEAGSFADTLRKDILGANSKSVNTQWNNDQLIPSIPADSGPVECQLSAHQGEQKKPDSITVLKDGQELYTATRAETNIQNIVAPLSIPDNMLQGLIAWCAEQGDLWLSPRAMWRLFLPNMLMATLPNRALYYLLQPRENYEDFCQKSAIESQNKSPKELDSAAELTYIFLKAILLIGSILGATLTAILAMASGVIKAPLYLAASALYAVGYLLMAGTETLKMMFSEANTGTIKFQWQHLCHQQLSSNVLFKYLFAGWQPNARDLLIALATALFVTAVIFSAGSALGIIPAAALPGFASTILSPFTSVFTAFTAWATPGLSAAATLVGWHAAHAVTILAAVSFSLLSYASACLTFTVLEKIFSRNPGHSAADSDNYLSFTYNHEAKPGDADAAEVDTSQISARTRISGFFRACFRDQVDGGDNSQRQSLLNRAPAASASAS